MSVENETHTTTINNLKNPLNILTGTLEFIPTHERQEFISFYCEMRRESESSNQSSITQQRKRYYAKQILLHIRKVSHFFSLLNILIIFFNH